MKHLARLLAINILILPISVMAAETTAPSATVSILKMIVGLIVVLGVMAALAWGAKRFLPHASHHNNVVKIVGGTSVGNRERVVVLEIADRWIVVGVANGQVNALANLTPNMEVPADVQTSTRTDVGNQSNQNASGLPPFAKWLKQSMNKLIEK
jgi:flagellar protein FliO/FliZ